MEFDWNAAFSHPLTQMGAGMMSGADPRRTGFGGIGQGLMNAQRGLQAQQELEQRAAAQREDAAWKQLQMDQARAKMAADAAQAQKFDAYAKATPQERRQMGPSLFPAQDYRQLMAGTTQPKPVTVAPGSALVSPVTGKPLYQQPFKPEAPAGAGDAWKMRKDVEKQEAPYQEVSSRAHQIMAAVNNPGAFSDITLASNIAKFLDPSSVVRPTETETIAEAGGLVNSIRASLMSAAGEGMITPPVRKEINAMMNRLLKIYKKEYSAQRKDTSDFLGSRNLPGDIMGSPVDFPAFSTTVIDGLTVESLPDEPPGGA